AYTPIGDAFPPGREARSLRIALFTWNGEKEGGHADFGSFRYAFLGPARPDADALAPNLIP
ncbi:MAG TPA: hypothetical protein VIM58_02900, partial [Candidatus Methylacidiphilales bacterium]